MTKRFLSILAMLSIAAMMFLSSCTAAGVECGLIGKWEYKVGVNSASYEITSDDKIIVRVNGIKQGEFVIESVSDHTIKTLYGEMEYQNLTCDSVEFKDSGMWVEFNRVY